MIDIDKVFSDYVSTYDMSNNMISRKYDHSYRVKKLSESICEYLELDEENKSLASLIGLLHDIGRFEQIRIYNSFIDRETIDHANFGVKLLFEDKLIRNYIIDEKYDTIIYNAIKNHNKLSIETGFDDITNLHCKIIRDADKIDIFYIIACIEKFDYSSDGDITKEVEEDFFSNRSTNNKYVNTNADRVIRLLSFIYDLNYDFSYKYILNEGYIDKLFEQMEDKEKMKKYFEHIKKYIRERSDNKC